MKSLMVLTFLIALISLSAKASVICENKEVLVNEDMILTYKSCNEGLSLHSFEILSSDIGHYQCDKISENPLVVECLYKVCARGDGLLAASKCDGLPEKDLVIEVEKITESH